MKKILIIIAVLNATQIQAQDLVRNPENNDTTNYQWFEYPKESLALKITSRISLVAGGTLLVIGVGKEISNSIDRTGVDIYNGFSSLASGFLAGITHCSTCTTNGIQLPYSEPRKTTKYFVSGAALVGIGGILAFMEIKFDGNAIQRHNSKKLYRLLRASTTRNGVSMSYNF